MQPRRLRSAPVVPLVLARRFPAWLLQSAHCMAALLAYALFARIGRAGPNARTAAGLSGYRLSRRRRPVADLDGGPEGMRALAPRRRHWASWIAIVVIAATAALMLFQSRGTARAMILHRRRDGCTRRRRRRRITELVVHENDAVKRDCAVACIDPQPHGRAGAGHRAGQCRCGALHLRRSGVRWLPSVPEKPLSPQNKPVGRKPTWVWSHHRATPTSPGPRGYVARQQRDHRPRCNVRDATTLARRPASRSALRQAVDPPRPEAAPAAAEAALASAQSAPNTVRRTRSVRPRGWV